MDLGKLFVLIPLIVTIGTVPIIPFSDASPYNQICIDKVWLESIKGKIACVTPSTAEKLVERGWGTLLDEEPFVEKSESDRTLKDEIFFQRADPLPSWNDGPSKQKIIEFVKKITDQNSDSFVLPKDRIATFDNDGTLWVEKPLYIPFEFHLEYLYEQIKENPSLALSTPYSEILAKQDSLSNEDLKDIDGLFELLVPAYPGISQEEYLEKSKDFLENTYHSRFKTSLKNLTYLPMVELIHYLQENDFQVYIVSGGFQGMMRSVSEEIYNIDKRNVIGTHPEFIFKLTENGPQLIRQASISTYNDGPEKPVNIQKFIGKKPIFACGNSAGDIEMLTLTHFYRNHFGCMMNHDDEIREYYYPNNEVLNESEKNDWVVISMKNDFKTVFSNTTKITSYQCTPDFWKNNLDLWQNLGVDYNADFDQTFGRNYFEPDITLKDAISMEGAGIYHLARSGTSAYLSAIADPEFDENSIKTAVNFGYVHQIDQYLVNCKLDNTKIP